MWSACECHKKYKRTVDQYAEYHLSDFSVNFSVGPLTGAPLCRMSILRNDDVPCHCLCNYHVDSNMA